MKKVKNKAFTLIELIIVIAIIGIIMLIGTVAYTGIQERTRIRADRQTAGQIGRALVIRENDVEEDKKIPYYPELTKYDQLEEIENYISKEIKPQSMKDGNFIVTALKTENGKKIIVGIGKEGDKLTDEPYENSKEAGWAWSEDVEINKFIEENKDKITEESVVPGGSSGSGGTGNSGTEPPAQDYTLTVGINNTIKAETQKEAGKSTTITSGGTYTEWEIIGINKTGGNITFNMPENNVKITGKTGK